LIFEHSRFARSDEEKAQGLILACRAILTTDAIVAWLDGDEETPSHPRRSLNGRVTAIADATHDIKHTQIVNDVAERLAFTVGQYARLLAIRCWPKGHLALPTCAISIPGLSSASPAAELQGRAGCSPDCPPAASRPPAACDQQAKPCRSCRSLLGGSVIGENALQAGNQFRQAGASP
jgi:hypothetical protein